MRTSRQINEWVDVKESGEWDIKKTTERVHSLNTELDY